MPVPISNLSSTFSDATKTYVGLGLNVSYTAAAAGSRLFEIKLNNEPKFWLGLDGMPSTGISAFDLVSREKSNAAMERANIGIANTNFVNTSLSYVNTAMQAAFSSANIAIANVNYVNTAMQAAFAKANSVNFSANVVISTSDDTNAALRITQTGLGPAIRIEDETNPDSTPVIVDATGNVLVGRTTSTLGLGTKLDVNGSINASAFYVNGTVISGLGNSTSNNVIFNDNGTSNGSNSLIFYKSNNTLAAANLSVVGTTTFITANSINVTNLVVSGAITYSVANNIIVNKTEVNSFIVIANTNATAATSNIIDQFLTTDYRSAHYRVTMNAGTNFTTMEMSLVHNDSTVQFVSNVSNVCIGAGLGSLSATYVGTSNIRVNLASTLACTTVRIFRTAIAT